MTTLRQGAISIASFFGRAVLRKSVLTRYEMSESLVFYENEPVPVDGNLVNALDGSIFAHGVYTEKIDDFGNFTRAHTGICKTSDGAQVALSTLRPIKQTGGVGFGAGLNVENWRKENEAMGRIVILRETWGEIYQ